MVRRVLQLEARLVESLQSLRAMLLLDGPPLQLRGPVCGFQEPEVFLCVAELWVRVRRCAVHYDPGTVGSTWVA